MSKKKFIKAVNSMFNGSALAIPHNLDPHNSSVRQAFKTGWEKARKRHV